MYTYYIIVPIWVNYKTKKLISSAFHVLNIYVIQLCFITSNIWKKKFYNTCNKTLKKHRTLNRKTLAGSFIIDEITFN